MSSRIATASTLPASELRLQCEERCACAEQTTVPDSHLCVEPAFLLFSVIGKMLLAVSQRLAVHPDRFLYSTSQVIWQRLSRNDNAGSLALALRRFQDPALLVHRASIYCRIGQSARGLADLEQAQQLDAKDINLWRASAAVKVGLGQFASAMSDLNQAARLQPESAAVASERSIIHLHRGCFEVRTTFLMSSKALRWPWARTTGQSLHMTRCTMRFCSTLACTLLVHW